MRYMTNLMSYFAFFVIACARVQVEVNQAVVDDSHISVDNPSWQAGILDVDGHTVHHLNEHNLNGNDPNGNKTGEDSGDDPSSQDRAFDESMHR